MGKCDAHELNGGLPPRGENRIAETVLVDRAAETVLRSGLRSRSIAARHGFAAAQPDLRFRGIENVIVP